MSLKKITAFLAAAAICLTLTACNRSVGAGNKNYDVKGGEIADDNEVTVSEPDATEHNFALISQDGGSFTYECADCGEKATVVIACASGTENAYTVEGNTITFRDITEASEYGISGNFYGNIVIDVTEDYKFELQMCGFEMYSFTECPLTVLSGDKVTLSAKSTTENYIYDMRGAVTDDEEISASVYAMCDFNVQGKGYLSVKSINNNGIHTKDDLNVKNLTLQVDCMDNALKGNDSVTVESGNITLIARQGDGIKTSNSDISSKGNQRGTVAITGGIILIYAACDGIDAAYDAAIDESSASVTLQIFTDRYSKYSEEITAVAQSVYYIRTNSTDYRYSLKFYNNGYDAVWCNSTTCKTSGMYSYFPIEKPDGYAYVQLYIYAGLQKQGQDNDYIACTDQMTVNNNYDTIALQQRGNSFTCGWTNYSTSHGGMNDGNADKGDYSTKGIKADNAIDISAGKITVSAYDDAVHANNDVALENGDVPSGNVTVSGGDITLRSNDDGIHGDGTVKVSGGTVNIVASYEGVEGNTVIFGGGNVSVISSDDGVNGTASGGTGITLSGGTLYVCAGGDGLDANSTTNYVGIVISGGRAVIFSTGYSDSSIDTERGYTFTGGYVVGICRNGGMSGEAKNCPNFSSVGTDKTLSLEKDGYLVVDGIVTVKMPVTLNALVVVLGRKNASISSSSSTSYTPDANGVYWS